MSMLQLGIKIVTEFWILVIIRVLFFLCIYLFHFRLFSHFVDADVVFLVCTYYAMVQVIVFGVLEVELFLFVIWSVKYVVIVMCYMSYFWTVFLCKYLFLRSCLFFSFWLFYFIFWNNTYKVLFCDGRNCNNIMVYSLLGT